MKIRDAIIEVHSKAQAEKIANYVGDDPDRFAELMRLMMGRVYRITQRAAWPVSLCVERHPELIKPYWGKLVRQLVREDALVAVRRNVARLLQFVEIPERFQGRIYDACCKLVADPTQPVAVRCFSMSVAANIAKNDEALLKELRLLVVMNRGATTAGLRARTRRVLGV